MTQRFNDSFVDLEKHQVRLKEQIPKLEASLKHWQTWDAEYAELRDDLQHFDDAPIKSQILTLAENFGGKVVVSTEIKQLYEPNNTTLRSTRQVVDLLTKRIQYVEQNIISIKKQLETVTQKLSAVQIIEQPTATNEDGLPIMEIVEELDNDGNIISGKATASQDSTPQMIEALSKVGVTVPGDAEAADFEENPQIARHAPEGWKGTASEHPDIENTNGAPSTQLLVGQQPDTNMAYESLQSYKPIDLTRSVIPEDEPAEDAALRQQILNYNSGTLVGQVVAEMTLDSESIGDDSDWDNDEEDAFGSHDASDEEDAWGKSKSCVLTDEYAAKMRAVEKRLKAQMLENAGPEMVLPHPGVHEPKPDELRGIDMKVDQPGETKTKKAKKGVRFADELDIAHQPLEPHLSLSNVPEKSVSAGPLSQTLVESVVEREVSSEAIPPDDEALSTNPELLLQEVAKAHRVMRNRMVYKEGGFLQDEEPESISLAEDQEVQPKISRFKAARLRG
ncbi:MAG: hypothetical protein M1814_000048 [Vezdaea aestivalis]|nr:MAG: hypothetical protein M1814_000048 [Vezdaea aestivalis]